MNQELDRLPDYACHQTIDRFGRFGAEKPWDKIDTLQLEVGMSNNREMYSWAGARQFQESQLSDLVGRGVAGTGHFALLARHVFLPGAGKFSYKGESEVDGRQAHEWSFEVPLAKSRYRLRTAHAEAVVAFLGTIWADTKTLDVVRMEIQAYDLPEKLALVEAGNVIRYQRVRIGDKESLLPIYSELMLVSTDGNENLNRQKLGECRQYLGEAKVSFESESKEAIPAKVESATGAVQLPRASVLELELAEPLVPVKAVVGQPLKIRMSRALRRDEQILLAEGSEVAARVVRLERQETPFPLWEIGIELVSVQVGTEVVDLRATLIDAGPESGLLRLSKTFMPKFTKKRTTRMDILVRETPKGQAILHWDAKRPQVPKGLRMKWRVE